MLSNALNGCTVPFTTLLRLDSLAIEDACDGIVGPMVALGAVHCEDKLEDALFEDVWDKVLGPAFGLAQAKGGDGFPAVRDRAATLALLARAGLQVYVSARSYFAGTNDPDQLYFAARLPS